MQIDLNALNLAVATKLSSMGQEWGWRPDSSHCNIPCPPEYHEMYASVARCDKCPTTGKVPLDFCADPYAFGRLVEYVLRRAYKYNDGSRIMLKVVNECNLFGLNPMVALAQAFIGGEK